MKVRAQLLMERKITFLMMYHQILDTISLSRICFHKLKRVVIRIFIIWSSYGHSPRELVKYLIMRKQIFDLCNYLIRVYITYSI